LDVAHDVPTSVGEPRPVWDFEVALSSHALLHQGVTEAEYLRVRVAAATSFEASLIAIQMAYGFRDGLFPTDCVGPL
jgi:hypothetical protein